MHLVHVSYLRLMYNPKLSQTLIQVVDRNISKFAHLQNVFFSIDKFVQCV